MAIKEPWNIYSGYVVDCKCDNISAAQDSGTWTNFGGNSIDYIYDANNNVETAIYKTNGVTVFTQTFAYDLNNNCISITTT